MLILPSETLLHENKKFQWQNVTPSKDRNSASDNFWFQVLYSDPDDYLYSDPDDYLYSAPDNYLYSDPDSYLYSDQDDYLYSDPDNYLYSDPDSYLYSDPDSDIAHGNDCCDNKRINRIEESDNRTPNCL